MLNVIPGVKNFKARRASVRDLRSREDELKNAHQQMRALDALFKNGPQVYHTEHVAYSEKIRELNIASTQRTRELRPSRNSDLSMRTSRR
ncbi:hypothetical protein NHQ30_004638 [Ciborinia camelliae]|nr:hypothetical protein NHQ30_004638 [Ciborinia camelliae]